MCLPISLSALPFQLTLCASTEQKGLRISGPLPNDRQPGSYHFINIHSPSIQRQKDLTEGILERSSDFLGRLSSSWARMPILAFFGQSPLREEKVRAWACVFAGIGTSCTPKSSTFQYKSYPSGAEARVDYAGLAARLKSCPFKAILSTISSLCDCHGAVRPFGPLDAAD